MENTIVYTPAAITREYLQAVNAMNAINRTVKIRGIVESINKGENMTFANLVDKESGDVISLYFSMYKGNTALLEDLYEGMETILVGNLSLYTKNSYVKLSMTPISIEGQEITMQSRTQMQDEWGELLKIKRNKGYKNVYNAFQNALDEKRKPRVLLVRPMSITAEEDIKRGMGTAEQEISIRSLPCDFKNPTKVAEALTMANKTEADVVILTRGGGEALGVMDNPLILKQLVNMEKTVIVGLGHEKDKLKAEALADRACSVPYEIGKVLKDIYYERGEVIKYKYLYENTLQKLNDERYNYRNKGADSFYGVWGTDSSIVKGIIVALMILGVVFCLKLLL